MIDKIKCNKRIGNDINEYVVALLKAIQSGWNPLETVNMDKELYNEVKSNFQNYKKEVIGLVGLCSTYNAKWFGGYAGVVNTKIGTKRNYYDEAVRNLLSQKDSIQGVKFISSDYLSINEKKLSNMVIYCDPPYKDTTKYKDGDFEHDVYWQWVRDVSKDNYVLCSEYSMPNDFVCIWEKKLTTTLDKNSRSSVTEKLFTYKNGKYFNQYPNS